MNAATFRLPFPGPFTRAGNFVFTGAYEAEHGREPWAIPVADVVAP